MKILILQDDFLPFGNGGAAVVSYNLAKGYKAAGHNVLVISTTGEKRYVGSCEYDGIPIYRIFSSYHERWRAYRSLYNPAVISKIKKLINTFKPDVVHAHNIHYHISYHSLRIAKKTGARVTLTVHDMMLFHYGKFFPVPRYVDKRTACASGQAYKVSFFEQIRDFGWRYNPLRNIMIRLYLKNVDNICAVSYALKGMLEANGISNSEVVYNATRAEDWDKPSSTILDSFRRVYGLPDKRIALFVGTPSYAKGWRQLNEAIAEAKNEIPDIVVVVAGGAKAKTISESSALCTGWLSREDMMKAYHISDVVVLPSICFETFGMSALEAMSAKKPVVATCIGGVREVVRNEETGYTCNPYDRFSFSRGIIDLLRSPDKAKKFGEAGYLNAASSFSLDTQVRKYLTLFEG